jgi:hypothetical protein
MLFPIVCFIHDENGDTVLPLKPEELDDLMIDAGGLIPKVIPVLRNYWRSKSGTSATPRRAGRKTSTRRNQGRK